LNTIIIDLGYLFISKENSVGFALN
jgi:hypothetical protein